MIPWPQPFIIVHIISINHTITIYRNNCMINTEDPHHYIFNTSKFQNTIYKSFFFAPKKIIFKKSMACIVFKIRTKESWTFHDKSGLVQKDYWFNCIWYDPVAVVSNNKNNVSSVMYEDSQVLTCHMVKWPNTKKLIIYICNQNNLNI